MNNAMRNSNVLQDNILRWGKSTMAAVLCIIGIGKCCIYNIQKDKTNIRLLYRQNIFAFLSISVVTTWPALKILNHI